MTATKRLRLSSLQLGAVLVTGGLVVGYGLFHKAQILATLHPGDKVKVDFSRDYRLKPFISRVKIAGVPVGVVTGVKRDGSAVEVDLKVDKGVRGKLGTAPSAAVRPTTLLGGNYYVELRPGGDPGTFSGAIPVARTTIPVELDRVLESVGPEQRKGLQTLIGKFDSTLRPEGSGALTSFLHAAPSTLQPAGSVFDAFRGSNPGSDLTDLVSGLDSTARVLTAQKGQLASLLVDAAGTTKALSVQRDSFATTLRDAPDSLAAARQGLQALGLTLDEVRITAPKVRASVRSATGLLAEAGPVLAQARPLLADLRPLAADLRPLLHDLVPVTTSATGVLSDVNGAVIQRLQGPILSTVLSPYRGSTPFYQELAYMFAGLDATSDLVDRNGATIAFDPGGGVQSVGGTPVKDPLPGQGTRSQRKAP